MPQFNSPFTDPKAIQESLEKKRLRLRELEAQYLRDKEHFKSQEWQEKRDKVLFKLERLITMYRPGLDSLSLAIAFGQMKEIILQIQEASDVIIEYEDIQQYLKLYSATRQQE